MSLLVVSIPFDIDVILVWCNIGEAELVYKDAPIKIVSKEEFSRNSSPVVSDTDHRLAGL